MTSITKYFEFVSTMCTSTSTCTCTISLSCWYTYYIYMLFVHEHTYTYVSLYAPGLSPWLGLKSTLKAHVGVDSLGYFGRDFCADSGVLGDQAGLERL